MSSRKTEESYELNSEHFIQQHNKLGGFARRDTFTRFAARLPGKRVVDLGSGPGYKASELERLGLSVLCIDTSAAMVAACRERGLEAEQGDLRELQLPAESFAGAWAAYSLLHFSRAECTAMLQAIARTLVARGVLMASVKTGKGEQLAVDTEGEGERYFCYWTPTEFLQAAEDFSVESIEEFEEKGEKRFEVFLRKITP